MKGHVATAAIVTGDIDAAFGGSQWLGLQDLGVARVIFRTTGGDPYLYTPYNFQITEAKRLGLIRNAFDFKEWVEPKFLEAALRELQLEGAWRQRNEEGVPQT